MYEEIKIIMNRRKTKKEKGIIIHTQENRPVSNKMALYVNTTNRKKAGKKI